MKIDIIDSAINVEKLDKTIDSWKYLYKTNPYLMMSTDTCKALAERYGYIFPRERYDEFLKDHPGAYIGAYTGCKIYCDDDLGFGEIDIR